MNAMVGIAPQLDRHAVLDRHEHAARVGAIERADVLDDGQCGVAFNGRHGEFLPGCGAAAISTLVAIYCRVRSALSIGA